MSFPSFEPATVEWRLYHDQGSQIIPMPFQAGAVRQALAKTDARYADSLTLQGVDRKGDPTRRLKILPKIFHRDSDSSLARCWAADPNRIADFPETDLGMRYGILSKGSYFQAAESDGIEIDGNTWPNGNPTLPSSVRKKSQASSQKNLSGKISGGQFLIDLPSTFSLKKVWLLSIDGKRIALPPEAFRLQGSTWTLSLEWLRTRGWKTGAWLLLEGRKGERYSVRISGLNSRGAR
jgi:hypothetical protein